MVLRQLKETLLPLPKLPLAPASISSAHNIPVLLGLTFIVLTLLSVFHKTHGWSQTQMLKGRESLTPTGIESNFSFNEKHAVLQRGLNQKAWWSIIVFAFWVPEG